MDSKGWFFICIMSVISLVLLVFAFIDVSRERDSLKETCREMRYDISLLNEQKDDECKKSSNYESVIRQYEYEKLTERLKKIDGRDTLSLEEKVDLLSLACFYTNTKNTSKGVSVDWGIVKEFVKNIAERRSK